VRTTGVRVWVTERRAICADIDQTDRHLDLDAETGRPQTPDRGPYPVPPEAVLRCLLRSHATKPSIRAITTTTRTINPQMLSPIAWVEVVVCSPTEIDTPKIAAARNPIVQCYGLSARGAPDHRVNDTGLSRVAQMRGYEISRFGKQKEA
jgi:hypothetical protein